MTSAADRIAEAIRQLGNADYGVREHATRTLWGSGKSAEPALRAATKDPNPEVARRARVILSNLAYGLTPDMSGRVIALLTTYRTGDAATKDQAAEALAMQGPSGARVLLTLRTQAADARDTDRIIRLMWRYGRDMALVLIADGDARAAGQVLAIAVDAAEDDTGVAMNYAALLLANGGLSEAVPATSAKLDRLIEQAPRAAAEAAPVNIPPNGIAQRRPGEPNWGGILEPPLEVRRTARLLAILRRANGDLPGAKAAAERSGSPELLRDILIEIGDWKELARLADDDLDDRAGIDALAFGAAFHRLAGDDAGLDKYATRLRAAAFRQPDATWDVAEGLFLNGRTQLGMDVLTKGNELVTAIEFTAQRLAFAGVRPLVERARGKDSADLRQVEAAAARAAWFAGDAQTAAASLDGIAKDCERRHDLNGFIAVIGAGADLGLTDRVRWYMISALQLAVAQPALIVVQPQNGPDGPMPAERSDPLAQLFTKAHFRDGAAAAAWWNVLRQRFPKQPAGKTLESVRAIDERRMKGDEVQAMCDASALDASRRPPEVRDAQLELVAATLDAFGRRPTAAARYVELAKVADQSSPARATAALCKLAAFDADAGHFRASAEGYFRAWSRDRADPVPLYQSGLALSRIDGDASLGRQRMEQAHLIPLADDNRRHALYQFLLDHKLIDEAKRERDIILRTAKFLSWARSDALRRAGDDAYAAGDALAAADLWERAFLDNNDLKTGFVEPWANIEMPALVHRTRAVGLVKAGRIDAALAEADASIAISPANTDTLIQVVSALDSAGRKTEADALYQRVSARYARLSAEHPQSGPLHNLCAWAAAKCGRDLDAALAHAKTAVQLQPKNTASLDTLAETHFQRREYAPAIAAMQKCVELEHDDARHKQQLERYRKAAALAAPSPAAVAPAKPAAGPAC